MTSWLIQSLISVSSLPSWSRQCRGTLDLELDAGVAEEGWDGEVSLLVCGEVEVLCHGPSELWVAVTSWRPPQALPRPGSAPVALGGPPFPPPATSDLQDGNRPSNCETLLTSHPSRSFTPFFPGLLHPFWELHVHSHFQPGQKVSNTHRVQREIFWRPRLTP